MSATTLASCTMQPARHHLHEVVWRPAEHFQQRADDATHAAQPSAAVAGDAGAVFALDTGAGVRRALPIYHVTFEEGRTLDDGETVVA